MRTAVVTGAGSGIGQALATQLSTEGYRVHWADVAAVDDLARALGGVAASVDVTDPAQVDSLAAAAADAEIVCLNAGVVGASMGPPWEAPLEEWHTLLGVNLLGVVNGLRAFVPRLLARAEPGHLVVTASLAGLVTFPAGGAYAATKHALVAVAEQTAMALRDTDVGVTVLCPALVRTGMSAEGQDPVDVAEVALASARAGRFLVAPEEWSGALRRRTEHLLAGEVPTLPEPDG